MHDQSLQDQTCRIALAAYLHDLGKLAERAGAFDSDPRLEANLQLYSPFHREGGWFSHRHAAHTALAIDHIEPYLPELLHTDPAPFVGRATAGNSTGSPDPTDSFINAAAAHHKPNTFLQWVIATADRVASGFEREEFEQYNEGREETSTGRNHYQARQLTLFEQIHRKGAAHTSNQLDWRYPLRPLSPQATVPRLASECEPSSNEPAKAEYLNLWLHLCDLLRAIPPSHQASLPLWLDHFDSLWLTVTHAVPAATAFGVRPEVSLYDHSRTTAALAAALWRWHWECGVADPLAAVGELRSRADWDQQKLLLIQGDFFGIQDFIFAAGSSTSKRAAKLLRGRSMQVSLFTEAVALRVLDSLALPPTSQVINAAGKFLILAPNTPSSRKQVLALQASLNEWFEHQTFGMAGVGLAWEPASCNDFLRRHGERNQDAPFSKLLRRLGNSLERAKFRRFNLAHRGAVPFTNVSFPNGPCAYNGRFPADRAKQDHEPASCALSRDQICIGEAIVSDLDRVLIVRAEVKEQLSESGVLKPLSTELFGYILAFTRQEEATGRFGALASSGALRRCWDYSAPGEADVDGTTGLFKGYARRFINGFVPRVSQPDLARIDRYDGLDAEDLVTAPGALKTLDMLACEDRTLNDTGAWTGISALGVVKGDVDDLGETFREGLRQPSFAKWAALSRQVHAYFAIRLPWLLARHHPSIYTVFAGGDDFFLIGPWRSAQRLVASMRDDFRLYVADNPAIHFSVGLATAKPGAPIQSLADAAESALVSAKSAVGKNAITCFGITVPWTDWSDIERMTEDLQRLKEAASLSTGYLYSLLQFIELENAVRTQGAVAASIWRARLTYRTRRHLLRLQNLSSEQRQQLQQELMATLAVRGIERHGTAFRIPLFNHLYRMRNR